MCYDGLNMNVFCRQKSSIVSAAAGCKNVTPQASSDGAGRAAPNAKPTSSNVQPMRSHTSLQSTVLVRCQWMKCNCFYTFFSPAAAPPPPTPPLPYTELQDSICNSVL